MSAAHETDYILGRRLGRRPVDPNRYARALSIGPHLTGTVPPHAAIAEHYSHVSDWGLYSNDRFGDCGPTAVANQRRLITKYLAGRESDPLLSDVFDLYRRSGNPDFNPISDTDDNGVNMQVMLDAVHAGGIGGVKSIAFATVDHTNLDECRAAIAIFGSLLLGVDLEIAQQVQTDHKLWDYSESAQWGGHAVLAGAYTSHRSGSDVSVISWAQVLGTTDAFWRHQVQEAWVVIWPEHLGTTGFQQGVNADSLAADYTRITGRPFPRH